jgi:mRNA-degrading endonuclease RelE of RelBE toxin-antitoxin system
MAKQGSGPWRVSFPGKVEKQKEKLPEDIKSALNLLRRELEEDGPERGNWPHYGKIKGQGKNVDMRHCHLNKGRTVYVAVRVVVDDVIQILEVRYVGTHENADYRRIS